MEFLREMNLSVAELFGYFFTLSFALLGLIVFIGLIGKLSQIRRGLRQMIARKTRNHRMLADRKKLRADGLKLEGTYFFEDCSEVSHAAGSYAGGKETSAPDAG